MAENLAKINESRNEDASQAWLFLSGIALVINLININIPGYDLVPIACLFFITLLSAKYSFFSISIPSNIIHLWLLIGAYLCYSFFFSLFYIDFDINEDLRIARGLASFVLIAFLLQSRELKIESLAKIIVFFCALHVLTIVIQILDYDLKMSMANLLGFDKESGSFRAFGLSMAYDTAGAWICIGMIFSSYLFKKRSNAKFLLLILFFWLGGLFTGRTFMLLGTFILFCIFLNIRMKINKMPQIKAIFNTLLILFLFILSYLLYKFGWIILDLVRFLIDQNYAVSGEVVSELADAGYYWGSAQYLFTRTDAFFMFDKAYEILFGFQKTLVAVDIGYLKDIYTNGVLGFIFSLAIYQIIFLTIYKKAKIHNMRFEIFLLIMLYLLMHIKLQVFFSSGYHELLLFIMMAKYSNEKENNKLAGTFQG